VWKHGHTVKNRGEKETHNQSKSFFSLGASGRLMLYMDVGWDGGGKEELNTDRQKFLKLKQTELEI
jgi:hypothetical protein